MKIFWEEVLCQNLFLNKKNIAGTISHNLFEISTLSDIISYVWEAKLIKVPIEQSAALKTVFTSELSIKDRTFFKYP